MPLFHKNLAAGMFIEKNFTFVYTEFLFLVLLFLGTNFYHFNIYPDCFSALGK